MLTLARDSRTIGNRDGFIAAQAKVGVAPLVPDDVPGPLAIDRPVAVIVAEGPRVEVSIAEVLSALLRESDTPVASQCVAPGGQVAPNLLMACGRAETCLIAHNRHSQWVRSTVDRRNYWPLRHSEFGRRLHHRLD